MSAADHWLMPASLAEARAHLAFEPRVPRVPRVPRSTGGRALEGVRIFVRDHKKRELAIDHRTLELRYAGFGFSQARKGVDGARRAALETRYGPSPRPAEVAGHSGRMFDLGPPVPEDDIDGRSPAVVAWADEDMLFFLSSSEISADELLVIARSVYAYPPRT